VNTAQYLTGSWLVVRVIHDRRLLSMTAWTGTAVFSPSDDGVHYVEEGTLELDGTTLATSRSYIYRPKSARNMDVFFDDGRPFHDLDLSSGEWFPEHFCGDDVYSGEFYVVDDNTLTIIWNVTGPTKDVRIESTLTRSRP
jgi:hypothetical protein